MKINDNPTLRILLQEPRTQRSRKVVSHTPCSFHDNLDFVFRIHIQWKHVPAKQLFTITCIKPERCDLPFYTEILSMIVTDGIISSTYLQIQTLPGSSHFGNTHDAPYAYTENCAIVSLIPISAQHVFIILSLERRINRRYQEKSP